MWGLVDVLIFQPEGAQRTRMVPPCARKVAISTMSISGMMNSQGRFLATDFHVLLLQLLFVQKTG